jgi:acyl-CoA thioesterase YciA
MTDTPAVHAHLNMESEPGGDLCIRTLAMPADTNANGDIFGGWLLSQMDLGGGVFASKVAQSRTVLVTDGNFTYVSIDDQGHPQAIKRDEPPIST